MASKSGNGISPRELNGLYWIIGRLPYSQVKAAREARKRNERLNANVPERSDKPRAPYGGEWLGAEFGTFENKELKQ